MMEKFAIALGILLVLSVVAGVIRKLKGGTFLPQAERAEDRLFMDKRGRWWREPQSGVVEDAYGRLPKNAALGSVLSCTSWHSYSWAGLSL